MIIEVPMAQREPVNDFNHKMYFREMEYKLTS